MSGYTNGQGQIVEKKELSETTITDSLSFTDNRDGGIYARGTNDVNVKFGGETGYKISSTGVSIMNPALSSYVPQPISVYEEYNHNLTFPALGNKVVTAKLIRFQDIVVLALPRFTASVTTGNLATLTATEALPTRFQPTTRGVRRPAVYNDPTVTRGMFVTVGVLTGIVSFTRQNTLATSPTQRFGQTGFILEGVSIVYNVGTIPVE